MIDRTADGRPEYRRWYNTSRWRRVRADQLAAEPLCRMCTAAGIIEPATVCDHIEPHRGDEEKFWAGPFQSLCKPHHDASKQREEHRGFSGAVDASGWPTDPRHHWNAPARALPTSKPVPPGGVKISGTNGAETGWGPSLAQAVPPLKNSRRNKQKRSKT